MPDYNDPPVPRYIRKNNSGSHTITDGGATLGRVLFYDTRLSVGGTVSCTSCHRQELAFGDDDRASAGVAGVTGRHSMRLVNWGLSGDWVGLWGPKAEERGASSQEGERVVCMRSLTPEYLEKLKFSAAQLETIGKIGAYQGKQALYVDQLPEVMKTLRKIAQVESVESSNRIEGIEAPRKQLHSVMYRYLPQPGGGWKPVDNEIVERRMDGSLEVRFKPHPAVGVPQAMAVSPDC